MTVGLVKKGRIIRGFVTILRPQKEVGILPFSFKLLFLLSHVITYSILAILFMNKKCFGLERGTSSGFVPSAHATSFCGFSIR